MHSMIAWFVRNSVAANLLMVFIVVLGLYTVSQKTPLESFPSFETDVITVSMSYRGATPAEVEEALALRIEEAVTDLEGIKKIFSDANEGSLQVRLEIETGYDLDDMLNEVKNRVDAINTFPADVENPVIAKVQRRREVISVALAADLPEKDLRRLGEQIRDELVYLPDISQVELVGVRPYELSLEIPAVVLQRYGLSLDDISKAIRNSSRDVPAGAVKTAGGEILLRTLGQAYTAEEYAKIVVHTREDGTRVTLGELASVRDGFEENPLFARFDGKIAVIIDVYRIGDQSVIDVANAVKAYIAEKQTTLSEGIELSTWRDRTHSIRARLQTLANSAMQGSILILLLLALFLRPSVAFWVALGVPISFMGALALMPVIGVTLNLISVFAFILVLGIVVDDAIVTGENIYRHLQQGMEPQLAAIKGTQEIAVPVTFGILTTVVAFVPLLMVEGVRGKIFAQIPSIIIPVLLFSLIESKLILPAHLKHVRPRNKQSRNPLTRIQQGVANGLEYLIRKVYRPILSLSLRWRYTTISLFIAVFMIIIALVSTGRIGYTFFPRIQSEVVQATLQMSEGTAFEVTAEHLDHMAAQAEKLRKKYIEPTTQESIIQHILVTYGYSGGRAGVSAGKTHLGKVSFVITPPEDRELQVGSRQLIKEWRKLIGTIPGVKSISFRGEIGHGGSPIDIQLAGGDYEQLQVLSAQIRERLSGFAGVFDIQDSFSEAKDEIRLRLKPAAETLGVSSNDLGTQVRHAFFGTEVQRIQRGRDDVRVMLRYPQHERRSLQTLQDMRIRTTDGREIPFSEVAEVEVQAGFSTISRVDRRRVINITADISKTQVDMNKLGADLQAWLPELLTPYPGISYTLEGEQKEQAESMLSLLIGAFMVLFALYALLAIPFRSYVQPLIVMSIIPFSLMGAILGHMIMGINLSIMSVMGMLALSGVVVNDSLVLVDYVNRRRREGMPLLEAVNTAGVVRFRAVLLTSLTTFVGLIPLLFEQSTQAQFLMPMAISLGFGILFATFITLLLIPANYLVLEDIAGLLRKIGRFVLHILGRKPKSEQVS